MVLLHFIKSAIGIFTIISGIIGLFLWKKEKGNYWYVFPIFLVILGSLDFIGTFSKNNINYYSYFVIPFQILFYIWLFSKEKSIPKWLPIVGVVVYLFSFIGQTYLFNNTTTFSSLSYIIGNFVLLILILRYLYSLSTSEKILYFTKEKMFWVSVGLLVFWLGSLPYFGLYNYLRLNYFSILISYTWLVVILDYLMYSLFICGFIWARKS